MEAIHFKAGYSNIGIMGKLMKKNSQGSIIYHKQESAYANFADKSFSWKWLEKPSLTKAITMLKNVPTLKVLEAGCGTGRVLSFLLRKGIAKENLTGIDNNSKFLQLAKARFPQVNIFKSDISDINPMFDNVFDLIICNMVLVDLNNQHFSKTITNFSHWLKLGGSVIILDAHPVRISFPELSGYFTHKAKSFDSPWGEKVISYQRTISDQINKLIEVGLAIDLMDEPFVPGIAKNDDRAMFTKYTKCPYRLLIKAHKIH